MRGAGWRELHIVEYVGFVDPRFWGVTRPNLNHIRPYSLLRDAR